MAYAAETTVPVEKTRAEIEKLLAKFKCSQMTVGSDWENHTAMVQFRAENRIIRFLVQLPDPKDKLFTQDKRQTWKRRAQGVIDAAVAQAERQRWRALFLVIKAKLESVESKIATFEEEFLAFTVLPNDQTVASVVLPLVAAAYETGRMPKLLPPGAGE